MDWVQGLQKYLTYAPFLRVSDDCLWVHNREFQWQVLDLAVFRDEQKGAKDGIVQLLNDEQIKKDVVSPQAPPPTGFQPANHRLKSAVKPGYGI